MDSSVPKPDGNLPAPSKEPESRRGRHKRDVVDLLRVWVHYAAVINVDIYRRPGTIDRLAGYPGQGVLKNARDQGLTPPLSALPNRNDSYVHKLAKLDGYEETIIVWETQLWRLLSVQGYAPFELETIITSLGTRLGLYRATTEHVIVGKRIRKCASLAESLTAPGLSQAFTSTMDDLALRGGIVELAFLAALFRQAADFHRFESAIYLRGALARALQSLFLSMRMNMLLAALFASVVGIRVIDRGASVPSTIELPKKWSPFTANDDPFAFSLPTCAVGQNLDSFRHWVKKTYEIEQLVEQVSRNNADIDIAVRATRLKKLTDGQWSLGLRPELDALGNEGRHREYADLFYKYPWSR